MSDPLSDVLRAVRLTGGVFLEAQFTAPWSVTVNVLAADCSRHLESATQLVAYHVVLSGRLVASVEGEPSQAVSAGEIILFPRNDGHMLASGPGIRPVAAEELVRRAVDGGLLTIDFGGGGEATRVMCGFLGTADQFNPLLSTLPRMLKLDVRGGTSRDWIEASVRFAAGELAAGRLASSNVLSRLSEVLLVEAVRDYASTRAGIEPGWLNGVRDQQIGKALAAIHQDIARPWTAEALARHVAMSRSAFVDRFTTLVGMPPIRYITVWRMQTAKLLIAETEKPVAVIAHEVGYESEEAFSRAFKRDAGVSPARWRGARAPLDAYSATR